MKLSRLILSGHRSVEDIDFDASPLTLLFGKNNAGKTNILEAIAGIASPRHPDGRRSTHTDRGSQPAGAIVMDLEPELAIDRDVAAALGAPVLWTGRLTVSFTVHGVVQGIPDEWNLDKDVDKLDFSPPDERFVRGGEAIATRPEALSLNWTSMNLHERVVDAFETLPGLGSSRWLVANSTPGSGFSYVVPKATEARLAQIISLANELVPDFVDGEISAHIVTPELWHRMPKILLEYRQRGATQCSDLVDAAGSGAARWMAIATQLALRIVTDDPEVTTLRGRQDRRLSRYILLLDEPEAFLHPGAVASIVRWSQRLARQGFNLVIASHHEEFLRSADPSMSVVHVTRDEDLVNTCAHTLPSTAYTRLRDLAQDVGVHPLAMLSLRRAVLFVEGPLDEAVLDEFASLRLDAAGVMILPIHGTKNLEGIVSVEVVTQMGMRLGILTDATVLSTVEERSNRKRSSEEKKVLRVIAIAKEKGLAPPTPFGVPEDDLLFALPPAAIRDYLRGPFPEWEQLVAECRAELGAPTSESVNWKRYARETYGLPIDSTEGVREIVRALDLSGVPIPSVSTVVDEIVAWALQTPELAD
jgi:energy-coupling factor transporter ATP-binding protein EcfA2